MNIVFNYVFVSVCKVNLLAQLLYVVMVKQYGIHERYVVLNFRKGPEMVPVCRKPNVGSPCLIGNSGLEHRQTFYRNKSAV